MEDRDLYRRPPSISIVLGAAAMMVGTAAEPNVRTRERRYSSRRARRSPPKRLGKSYRVRRYSQITIKRKAQKRARRITRLHKTTRR